MATTKKSTKKSTAKKGGTKKFSTSMSGFSTGMSGFKKGKTPDGKNVTFDEIIHYVQNDLEQREGVKLSLEKIKKVAYYIGGAIADNLAKGSKVCVSMPELGSFKTSVREYKIGGKSGKTKTVKFTPCAAFKENAKLGKK
ncbi:MAG: hypothetical protein II956_15970 [Bacteroidales bacterium]|nr:hypothetical protein [Bacteroidales bacterium]